VKKKIFSILFATILVLSMSLMTAVPAVAADTAAKEAAVIKTADKLVMLQNADGGFPWKLPTTGVSYTNILGASAMGIMEAWDIEAKPAYETALAKAYKYCVDKPPAYTWNSSENKYIETTAGVDSYSDITFLIKLASAADSDADLLAAIQAQVSGTEASNIAALAKTRWDNRTLYLGSTVQTPPNGTATGVAEYIRNVRHSQNYDALITWDLELGVEAAIALNNAFPGQGHNVQSADIANVIYGAVDDAGDVYFNSTNTTQEDYILGLTGAIKASAETGLHAAKASSLLTLLLNAQHADGYWNYYGATPAQKSVQSTAYAVMALFKEGSANAVNAASEAADWLVSSQNADGGWFAENGAGDEYAETDSEAAWALAIIAAGSSSVSMTAAYIPATPKIGISVSPTSISFGSVTPGTPSAAKTVTVTNTGNVAETVSASIENESIAGVYTNGLKINAAAVSAWTNSLAIAGNVAPELILTVPTGTAPGTYTATLIFWAEAQ